jgi:adenylyl- and sulfurtransferase ThiI
MLYLVNRQHEISVAARYAARRFEQWPHNAVPQTLSHKQKSHHSFARRLAHNIANTLRQYTEPALQSSGKTRQKPAPPTTQSVHSPAVSPVDGVEHLLDGLALQVRQLQLRALLRVLRHLHLTHER